MKFKQLEQPERQMSGSSIYLKLKDGDVARGVLRGEAYDYFIKWEGNKSQECAPDDEGAKFRFRVNLVIKENGALTAKILEGGRMIYQQLADLNESWDLEKTIVAIRRKGKGLETEYSVTPDGPNCKVSDAFEKQLAAVKLHDLEPEYRSEEPARQALFEEAPF